METSGSRLIISENWKITCHEAGHAVVAVRYGFSFEYVERGEGEHGEMLACGCPLDKRDRDWHADVILQWQHFYAAGAAAEMLLFGTFRPSGVSRDLDLHGKLEKLGHQSRSDGWDGDIQSVMNMLDLESVEMVAGALDRERKLNDQQVYELFGLKPPWW